MNDGACQSFDWIVHGARVVDGSGATARLADVGVRGSRIAAVGDLGNAAGERIDGRGLVLAPGFIDAHAHDDLALLDPPRMQAKLSQGVTTVIVGHCGLSAAPSMPSAPPAPLDLLGPDRPALPDMAAYLRLLRTRGIPVNAAALVGHTALRVRHCANLSQPASPRERVAMARAVAAALDAGAAGVSTGVFYPPARAADREELLQACAPLRGSAGLLSAHLRDEGDHIDSAIDEALGIGAALAVRTVVSHHKLVGTGNHGRSRQTLRRLARGNRLAPVCQDCYPYEASSTVLDPARVRIAPRVIVTRSLTHPECAGRELDAVAAEWGVDRETAAQRLSPGGAIYFSMHAADVRRILADRRTMIGSDGLPYDPRPHPRLWGSFARVLAWARESPGWLSLEAAVHRMTGLTAAFYGLAGRGRVEPGAWADLVLFDAQAVADRADYAHPDRPAAGILRVWVNGRQAWHAGRRCDTLAGAVLCPGAEVRNADGTATITATPPAR